MTNKRLDDRNDLTESSFADAMQGVTPLKQDKIHFQKHNGKQNLVSSPVYQEKLNSERTPSFHFSDEYEPLIDFSKTLTYTRPGFPTYYSKRLRSGDISPEWVLDLHGYNKEQAQLALADFIDQAALEHVPCISILHGVSGGILKHKIPHYLIQHPSIIAFHQAPLEWGGQGAVLAIVDLGDELEMRLGR